MSVAQFSDVEQCSTALCRMDLWFQGINEISFVIRKKKMFVLSNQKSKVQVIVNFMTPGMGFLC